MAEPSTTTLSVATAVGLAGGAFTGAALVVVTSKDLSIAKRCAYMVISLVAGYMAAPEIVNATPIHSTGIAGFFAAALVITITLQLIERVKSFDLLALLKKGD